LGVFWLLFMSFPIKGFSSRFLDAHNTPKRGVKLAMENPHICFIMNFGTNSIL
jgi:hypothetical protein